MTKTASFCGRVVTTTSFKNPYLEGEERPVISALATGLCFGVASARSERAHPRTWV